LISNNIKKKKISDKQKETKIIVNFITNHIRTVLTYKDFVTERTTNYLINKYELNYIML